MLPRICDADTHVGAGCLSGEDADVLPRHLSFSIEGVPGAIRVEARGSKAEALNS